MHMNLLFSSHYRFIPLLIGLIGIGFVALTWLNFTFSYLPMSDLILNIGLKADGLAFIMLTVVFSLGAIVMSYSMRYLISDLTRTRFLVQMLATMLSVIFLIFSSNLFTAFIAWQWIGFNLYQLLNHYHYQSDANRAAKKKFVVNRIGDICFLLAIVLCYHFYGTSEYADLSSQTSKIIHLPGIELKVHSLILSLVFVAIMTKSAQFPFHFWLPDTMQAPTPVSALMHAGVINAGGILLARLSPLLPQTHVLPYAMLLIGATTMIVGTMLKKYQPDIKKQLAYSTMGQMGYMLIQAALGCFAAAVFHLIAHGFYKAALFLNAGNELIINKINSNKQPYNPYRIFLVGLALTSLILGIGMLTISPNQTSILLLTFIGIAIHQMTTIILKNEIFSLKLIALLFVQGMLLGYFFILETLESWIDIPRYQLIARDLEYTLSSVVVFIYFCSEITSSTLKSNSKIDTLYIKLIEIFNIEKKLRHYVLNPIRSLGDYLNTHVPSPNQPGKRLRFTGFLALAVLFNIVLSLHEPNIKNSITISSCSLIIISLIMANRAQNLRMFILLLGITHLFLFILQYLSIGHLNSELILCYTSSFLGLFWLIKQSRHSNVNTHTITANHLTLTGLYITFSFFLLMGIPGSASFILWYTLISNSVSDPIMTISLMGSNVLLAIVILHALQDYAFNQHRALEIIPNKRTKAHIIFGLILFTNAYFGIFSLTDWI